MSNHEIDTGKVSLLTVTADNDGQRVDNFLISVLKGVPKTLVYRIIRKGEVRVNKGRVKADTRLAAGDVVRVPPLRIAERDETPDVSPALQEILQNAILHEDDGLLVVNKPHGLAVHGGSGVNLGLIEALRKMRPDHRFLELVHRLDRDTSGVIMIAKKRSVLTALQRMLANKSGISKKYLAMVHGHWPASVTEVREPLLRFERQSGERMVMVSPEGKTSLTKTTLKASGSHYSLIEAEPVTGRTHQIRVHCQFQGCSIAGDVKYCDRSQQDIDKRQGVKRLFLHAWQLSFRHPDSGERLQISALPDDEFSSILKKAGCEFAL
ncbi:23S rRNA pseudouridine(955/2504/2580) synthase RluC [Thalassolituus sp. ST750PaO-4]|jgi:23S rRNA pseudouridine955/2504/2580 synthase|uniref:23S rRNA pseudouridine(955/2504/2580) synthase RluC n=1 Tax=Thalassolituus sp. ST750PaO-4 TaxID=2742965 RepID=UPI001CE2F854|nr:23S rRNA pseudouridine(955/2504/2580) synthase RluC [Thalassolituus sp. ST750PaO-4]MCA6061073.1 23S rRNA pseudouridine(955/2504/2580) synthase RluC [Thalassolituus sp. ST750PaO-4]